MVVMCVWVSCVAYAEPTVLEIIPLNYRNADEIMPLIRPFAGADGTVSGMRNQLIIRATPENLAQIKQILASLDRTPQQLMITVNQGGQVLNNRDDVAVSGSARIGKNGRVTIPDSGQPQGAAIGGSSADSPRVRVLSSRGNESSANMQTVRVLEGSQAFIQVGQSVPVPERTVTRGPNGTTVTDTVTYRDVASGFYVTPRINGDRVTLDISTRNDTPGTQLGGANIQRASSTVSGRLGEWISVGGIDQEQTRSGNVNLSNERSVSRDSRSIQLKVDVLR
jgi:hypothetical protein